ncbi:hypothetical protein KFU94_50580 [Chloroflexi bacterium TSY]|nr:hypothetical protein [Chloroflexi bacterium TSY]
MRHLRVRSTYYLTILTFILLGGAALLFDGETAGGHTLLQSVPNDHGTVPATATPPGTIPPPACPAGVKAPERGKIMVFIEPVAIYSGCMPQISSAGVLTETGFAPTLLYHDPYGGFPEALGYLGEVFAVFDYSHYELDRLVTILETYKCEDIGRALEACRQVNGIKISDLGHEFVTSFEMRSENTAVIDFPNTEKNDSNIFIPFIANE